MGTSTARCWKRYGNNGVFHDSHKDANHTACAPKCVPTTESCTLSRKQIRVIAEALALQQTHAQLPEPLRARLSAALQELDRLVARIRTLLVEVARRTPPGA